jgi:DNA modification methylase
MAHVQHFPLVQSTVDAEYVMSYLTIQNDVVFDPLMGTGTTAVAAIKLKRKFVGIEKDTVMLQKTRHRISEVIS